MTDHRQSLKKSAVNEHYKLSSKLLQLLIRSKTIWNKKANTTNVFTKIVNDTNSHKYSLNGLLYDLTEANIGHHLLLVFINNCNTHAYTAFILENNPQLRAVSKEPIVTENVLNY